MWVYLMARAGAAGFVLDTIPAIARTCGYPVEEVEAILEKLSGPDKYSRSPELSGRRIAIVREPEFAIHLVNHSKYREKDHTAAERQRRHRAKTVTSRRDTVTVTQAEADVEAKAETEPSVAVDPTTERRSESVESPDGWPTIEVYGSAVVDLWHELRGSPFPQPGPADFLVLSDWHASGIPVRVVERGMKDCIQGLLKRRDRPTGKPLKYFDGAVREAYGQWRARTA